MYNMDEKDSLTGRLQKTQRMFKKVSYRQSTLVGTGQDGGEEWITVVATICTNGTDLVNIIIWSTWFGASDHIELKWK
jgi:hypothetical protein